jgi:hypothetical protein
MFLDGFRNARIPCAITRPDNYQCSVNATGPPTIEVGNDQLKFYEDDVIDVPHYKNIPCRQNDTPDLVPCSSVYIDWGLRGDATVTVEGRNILVSINGSFPAELTCTTLLPAGATVAAANGGPYAATLAELINATQANLRMREFEYVTGYDVQPGQEIEYIAIYTGTDLKPYRKESLVRRYVLSM